jgi:hypothetical protein
MVEADSHLKLLPASILDTYNAFEHIDMLSMGMWLLNLGTSLEFDVKVIYHL